MTRLSSLATVELSKLSWDHLKRLGKERNKLQHFGTTINRHQVGAIAGRSLDTLLVFVVDHLIPGASEADSVVLGEVKELLSTALEEIEVLGKARRDRLKGELGELADEVIGCPRCAELAFRFNPADLRCYFCEHVANWDSSNDLASDYAGNVLGASEYEAVHDGAEMPVHGCPDCEASASLVDGVTFRGSPEKPMYACFSCFTVYDQGEIGGCSRCHNGVYVRTPTDKLEEDGEIDVCSSCWDYIISRD